MDEIQVQIIHTKLLKRFVKSLFNISRFVKSVPQLGSQPDLGTWYQAGSQCFPDFSFVLRSIQESVCTRTYI